MMRTRSGTSRRESVAEVKNRDQNASFSFASPVSERKRSSGVGESLYRRKNRKATRITTYFGTLVSLPRARDSDRFRLWLIDHGLRVSAKRGVRFPFELP